uniref:Uncharacterized protein n=1 Tax=viral metagenome TaxID=1070528 RepID=A0A6H1ZB13_9ZZZZ
MKITLPWVSDKKMCALFSNIGCKNSDEFYLLMVFHKNRKGGFSRDISVEECIEILNKKGYIYKEYREVI